ncbi:MAG: hypothetical protein GWP04_05060, partial [Gammaproteobacteria bacterium]|nr:hypothetical protein [Gammaproteobacteria bacterium]
MRRIGSAVLLLLLLLLLVICQAATPALASNEETLSDSLNAVSYSGADGTLPWQGFWIEFPEFDGPATGHVAVVDDPHCRAGYCLRIGGADESYGAMRYADLSGWDTASLSFSYRRVAGKFGHLKVSISSNDGLNWVTLRNYQLKREDAAIQYEQIDISAYISEWTVIRFSEKNGDDSAAIFIDDVTVTVGLDDATSSTTTTAPTSTTTTTAPAAPIGGSGTSLPGSTRSFREHFAESASLVVADSIVQSVDTIVAVPRTPVEGIGVGFA